MSEVFPDFVQTLPRAHIPIKGCTAYLFQGKEQQMIFMRFDTANDISEHMHESQWEIVLEGEVEVWISGVRQHFRAGDRFFIPANIPHRARIQKGYAAIAIFDQPDRYQVQEEELE